MRKFSPIEQEVIKYIVSQGKMEEMCFSTLFIELMPTIALESTENGLRIYYKKSDGKTEDIVNLYWKRLLDILFLIKYLDDNTLIGVYHLKNGEGKILHSDKYEKEGNNFYITREDGAVGVVIPNFTDYYTDCGELLFYYINSCFHASETLRELVKNDFKDEDTIRFEKSMASTKKSIRISFMIGLASIIIASIGIWLNWKSLNQPSAFPVEQLDSIKTEIRNISKTIKNQTPLIINSLPKQDTLINSNMVKKIHTINPAH